MPLVRDGDARDRFAELLGEEFLAEIAPLTTGTHLAGAPVVMVSLLLLRRDGRAAFRAGHESPEGPSCLLHVFATLPLAHDLLHAVEDLLRDDGLMHALVNLALVPEEADVERIGEHDGNLAERDGPPTVAGQAPIRDRSPQFRCRVVTGCERLERTSHEGRLRLVGNDAVRAMIVYVSDRCPTGKLSATEFLAKPPLHVHAERVDHVFRLAETYVEHEAPLRCVLKPEGREVQRFELACVQRVDDTTTIDTVARESVGMPCENASRLACLDVIHHGIEDRASWLPGRLRLDQLGNNPEALLLRELPELGKLCVDRQELMPVVIRRFPGIEKVLHSSVPPLSVYIVNTVNTQRVDIKP